MGLYSSLTSLVHADLATGTYLIIIPDLQTTLPFPSGGFQLLYYPDMLNTTLAADQLTEDLRNIAAWCCKKSLLINPDKTKRLVLGTPQMLMKIPDDLSITLLSKKIISKSAKNLGVTMGCGLTYDERVTQVTSKCIFKVDRLPIIVVAKKIYLCCNCSSVGCLKCVQFHNWFWLL